MQSSPTKPLELILKGGNNEQDTDSCYETLGRCRDNTCPMVRSRTFMS